MSLINKTLKYLDYRLIGILRTKPGTPAINAINAIQTAFEAGIKAVEITSNSGHWQEVVTECVKKELNIGVGSIKNKELAQEAINHGARFLVSPGFFEDAIEVANKNKIPILPGVYTKDELDKAIQFGINDIKFFPANVSTCEELFKAIREPFRDEFDELSKLGWNVIASDPLRLRSEARAKQSYNRDKDYEIASPTQFYKLYLEAISHNKKNIVVKLPDGNLGFERLNDFVNETSKHDIRTYAVGGVNDKNMKEVLTKYGAYGVCPGSSMFNGDAIFNGDYERVKTDVNRHVEILKDVFAKAN